MAAPVNIHHWTSGGQFALERPDAGGADLRQQLKAILEAEEANPPEWIEVGRLSDELQRQLLANPKTRCPGIVSHFVDESDIRMNNEGFAKQQREDIRRYLSTGRYRNRTALMWWSAAVAAAVAAATAGWLFS